MAAKASRFTGYRVASIVGTRPEAIKMAPVVQALAGRGIDQQLILTGQHAGLAGCFDMIRASAILDLAVDAAELSPGELCERIHDLLCRAFTRERPDLVLVHGDTTSALAGALAARDCGIGLGHVEAGLRSFDMRQPWPEESNRIAIDRMAGLLFAPTRHAATNLAAEAQVRGRVFVTGNTGMDALHRVRDRRQRAPADQRRRLLVTCHRRENRGEPIERICAALIEMAQTLPVDILLPLHSNPHVRLPIEQRLGDVPHIALLPPVDHRAMVRLIEESWIVLTDSGGLQEEAAAIGRPVLVLRDVTERIEAEANLELVGADPDRIISAVSALLTDDLRYARMATPSAAFGDGRAAERIASIVDLFFSGERRERAV